MVEVERVSVHAIRQPVAIGVGIRRVGAQTQFGTVGQSVPIEVRGRIEPCHPVEPVLKCGRVRICPTCPSIFPGHYGDRLSHGVCHLRLGLHNVMMVAATLPRHRHPAVRLRPNAQNHKWLGFIRDCAWVGPHQHHHSAVTGWSINLAWRGLGICLRFLPRHDLRHKILVPHRLFRNQISQFDAEHQCRRFQRPPSQVGSAFASSQCFHIRAGGDPAGQLPG